RRSRQLQGHVQMNFPLSLSPSVAVKQSVELFTVFSVFNTRVFRLKCIMDCVLQGYLPYVATNFGVDDAELIEMLRSDDFQDLQHVRVRGLMGIATNTENEKVIKEEFYELKMLFDGIKASFFRKEDTFDTLSMGMSSDYSLAIEKGANMVRLGSTIFGKRVIKHYKNKD